MKIPQECCITLGVSLKTNRFISPISIAILSFLFGAYVMIVFVILYDEHLEKEYE